MSDAWPCGLDLPRMRALLDAGQDVNEKMKGGATALCKAAYKNRSDAVALLLEYEAAPNSQCTNGDTALHYAMTYGDFDGVVELMLRAGAQPGIRSHAGPSAYDLALNNKRRRSLALMDAEAESSSTADDESDGGRAPRRPRESSPAAGLSLIHI